MPDSPIVDLDLTKNFALLKDQVDIYSSRIKKETKSGAGASKPDIEILSLEKKADEEKIEADTFPKEVEDYFTEYSNGNPESKIENYRTRVNEFAAAESKKPKSSPDEKSEAKTESKIAAKTSVPEEQISNQTYFRNKFIQYLEKKIKEFTEKSGPKEKTIQVSTEVLLGSDGLALYKLALEEEAHSRQYFNAVLESSKMTVDGKPWGETPPMIIVGGPSGSGKSYAARAITEHLATKIQKEKIAPVSDLEEKVFDRIPSDKQTTFLSIDGGITREVSEMRKLVIQYGEFIGKQATDFEDISKEKLKNIKDLIKEYAKVKTEWGIILPETFASAKKKKIKEAQEIADSKEASVLENKEDDSHEDEQDELDELAKTASGLYQNEKKSDRHIIFTRVTGEDEDNFKKIVETQAENRAFKSQGTITSFDLHLDSKKIPEWKPKGFFLSYRNGKNASKETEKKLEKIFPGKKIETYLVVNDRILVDEELYSRRAVQQYNAWIKKRKNYQYKKTPEPTRLNQLTLDYFANKKIKLTDMKDTISESYRIWYLFLENEIKKIENEIDTLKTETKISPEQKDEINIKKEILQELESKHDILVTYAKDQQAVSSGTLASGKTVLDEQLFQEFKSFKEQIIKKEMASAILDDKSRELHEIINKLPCTTEEKRILFKIFDDNFFEKKSDEIAKQILDLSTDSKNHGNMKNTIPFFLALEKIYQEKKENETNELIRAEENYSEKHETCTFINTLIFQLRVMKIENSITDPQTIASINNEIRSLETTLNAIINSKTIENIDETKIKAAKLTFEKINETNPKLLNELYSQLSTFYKNNKNNRIIIENSFNSVETIRAIKPKIQDSPLKAFKTLSQSDEIRTNKSTRKLYKNLYKYITQTRSFSDHKSQFNNLLDDLQFNILINKYINNDHRNALIGFITFLKRDVDLNKNLSPLQYDYLQTQLLGYFVQTIEKEKDKKALTKFKETLNDLEIESRRLEEAKTNTIILDNEKFDNESETNFTKFYDFLDRIKRNTKDIANKYDKSIDHDLLKMITDNYKSTYQTALNKTPEEKESFERNELIESYSNFNTDPASKCWLLHSLKTEQATLLTIFSTSLSKEHIESIKDQIKSTKDDTTKSKLKKQIENQISLTNHFEASYLYKATANSLMNALITGNLTFLDPTKFPDIAALATEKIWLVPTEKNGDKTPKELTPLEFAIQSKNLSAIRFLQKKAGIPLDKKTLEILQNQDNIDRDEYKTAFDKEPNIDPALFTEKKLQIIRDNTTLPLFEKKRQAILLFEVITGLNLTDNQKFNITNLINQEQFNFIRMIDSSAKTLVHTPGTFGATSTFNTINDLINNSGKKTQHKTKMIDSPTHTMQPKDTSTTSMLSFFYRNPPLNVFVDYQIAHIDNSTDYSKLLEQFERAETDSLEIFLERLKSPKSHIKHEKKHDNEKLLLTIEDNSPDNLELKEESKTKKKFLICSTKEGKTDPKKTTLFSQQLTGKYKLTVHKLPTDQIAKKQLDPVIFLEEALKKCKNPMQITHCADYELAMKIFILINTNEKYNQFTLSREIIEKFDLKNKYNLIKIKTRKETEKQINETKVIKESKEYKEYKEEPSHSVIPKIASLTEKEIDIANTLDYTRGLDSDDKGFMHIPELTNRLNNLLLKFIKNSDTQKLAQGFFHIDESKTPKEPKAPEIILSGPYSKILPPESANKNMVIVDKDGKFIISDDYKYSINNSELEDSQKNLILDNIPKITSAAFLNFEDEFKKIFNEYFPTLQKMIEKILKESNPSATQEEINHIINSDRLKKGIYAGIINQYASEKPLKKILHFDSLANINSSIFTFSMTIGTAISDPNISFDDISFKNPKFLQALHLAGLKPDQKLSFESQSNKIIESISNPLVKLFMSAAKSFATDESISFEKTQPTFQDIYLMAKLSIKHKEIASLPIIEKTEIETDKFLKTFSDHINRPADNEKTILNLINLIRSGQLKADNFINSLKLELPQLFEMTSVLISNPRILREASDPSIGLFLYNLYTECQEKQMTELNTKEEFKKLEEKEKTAQLNQTKEMVKLNSSIINVFKENYRWSQETDKFELKKDISVPAKQYDIYDLDEEKKPSSSFRY